MPLFAAALNPMADHLATLVDEVSLHVADPGTTGANESSAGRQAITWTVAADGDIQITAAEEFTGGEASGPITHVCLRNSTSGTIYGSIATTGDATFSSTGTVTLTSLQVLGSST